jgi:hypothetical protein
MRSTAFAAVLAASCLCPAVDAQQAPPATSAASAAVTPKVGADYTPGWDMMTARERDEHRERMLAAPTPAECRRMRDEQIKSAAERARNRGIKDLPNARLDACGE